MPTLILETVTSARAAEAAGRVLAGAIEAAAGRTGGCRLAIPGGSALAALPLAQARLSPTSWSRVRLTWVDERCVPVADPQSNRGAFVRLGLPEPGLVLPLWEDEGGDAVARFAARFQREFAGGLDVLLLGLGEDGHVASLFPGHAALLATGAAVLVEDSPKPPSRRISLTMATLRSAESGVLLAVGESKRAALRRVMSGDAGLPTSAVRRLTIVTDLDMETKSDG